MKIELKDIKFGSCNECKRGKLSENEVGLIFPYDMVYHLKIGNMIVGLCPKCFEKLNKQCVLIRKTEMEVKDKW